MDRNIKKNGLVNFIALLAGGAISYGVSRQANCESDDAAIVLMATGVLVAAFSYFQMRLLEREKLEKLELDELAKAKGSTALFAQDADSYPAKNAREQFEKWMVPGFTIVLLAGAKTLEVVPAVGAKLATIFTSLGIAFVGASIVAITITLALRLKKDWVK